MQLARAVRNRTTGVLYVLDEPSIGLHPCNIVGLTGVMRDLVADGNSVILVDHDTQILGEADWIIEMGPGCRSRGRQCDRPGNSRWTFWDAPVPKSVRFCCLMRGQKAGAARQRRKCSPREKSVSLPERSIQ